MKIKTSELTDAALDWAVTYALYGDCASYIFKHGRSFHAYSTDWAQGGPIIEREEISTQSTGDAAKWRATVWDVKRGDFFPVMYGQTPLIAAMRCFVASRLGDEVEVPDGLN